MILDKVKREISLGDYVIFSVSLYYSNELRIGRVTKLHENGRLSVRYAKNFGEQGWGVYTRASILTLTSNVFVIDFPQHELPDGAYEALKKLELSEPQ